MNVVIRLFFCSLVVICSLPTVMYGQNRLVLSNSELRLEWKKTDAGYQLAHGTVTHGGLVELRNPLGKYTVLYAEEKPDRQPLLDEVVERAASFPDSIYGHIFNRWKSSLTPVSLQMAGEDLDFYPSHATQQDTGRVVFSHETDQFALQATWSLHPRYKNDLLVEITITARNAGYFSIASPILTNTSTDELAWGMIPGHFQGSSLASDLVLAYGYGQGIPDRPVMVRERTTSTLSPLITNKDGLTLAVVPQPEYGRDPWRDSKITHNDWKLGFSLMTRNRQLSPTVYHPVLGEEGSKMKVGETRTFRFRYTLQVADWYEVYRHVINNVYQFKSILPLKNTDESLSKRILAMSRYLRDDSISMWNVQALDGLKIGAQDYLSSVYDADGDAMKNSDYGAMWMLSTLMNDSLLIKERLPYARNFKIAQQDQTKGFFQGAALGQYYLWKSKRFVEEWGDYVEPIALTYYVMLDIGNILLFDPDDIELRKRLRLGADRLLEWQHADGRWEVAYDRVSRQPVFTDLLDLRPTFYGLLVAYRILGDKKYLQAACRGADWFIKNAVNKGAFLGVCGDFRFVPDFATGQSAQALLDLFDVTKDEKYKSAAVRTAQMYTAYVYTHPIPDRSKREVNGVVREAWEISQVGSRFEQGGLLGSANRNGPILMASHAGMFVRMFALTRDSLYIDMARAAAWGQDAFVNPDTHVASYYWDKMNAGVGRYPHHAWWQVGWIMHYLLAEIELRSSGGITFPRGFITPKVGPHQTYGFSSGMLYGKEVDLVLPQGLLFTNNERIDFIGAINKPAKELYIILLNNSTDDQTVVVDVNDVIPFLKSLAVSKIELLNEKGNFYAELSSDKPLEVALSAYGLNTLKITYQ